MRRKLRPRLTYANVASSIALFVAVGGGTAFAVVAANQVNSDSIIDGQVKKEDLAKDSVGTAKVIDDSLTSDDVKDGEVRNEDLAQDSVGTGKIKLGGVGNSDLAPDSIGAGKVVNNSLGGDDILESTLGTVPNAAKLNGGELCRTNGVLNLIGSTLGDSEQTICTVGPLSIKAKCSKPNSSGNAIGTIRLFTTQAGVYAYVNSGVTGEDDPTMEAGEAGAKVLASAQDNASDVSGNISGGSSSFAAGAINGTHLAGDALTRVTRTGTESAACEFVVAATS